MFDKDFLYKIYDKFCFGNDKVAFVSLNHRNTRGIICVDKVTGKTDISRCHKDDKFDSKIGCAIAYCRLKNIPIKESKDKVEVGCFYKVNEEDMGYCFKISEDTAMFVQLTFDPFKRKYRLDIGSLKYYKINQDSFEKIHKIDFHYFEPVDITLLNNTYIELVKKEEETKDVKFRFKDGCGVEAIYYNGTWYNLTNIPETHHIIRALAYAKLKDEGKSMYGHLAIYYSDLKKKCFVLDGKTYYVISAGLPNGLPVLYTFEPLRNEYKQFSFEIIGGADPADAIYKLYR